MNNTWQQLRPMVVELKLCTYMCNEHTPYIQVELLWTNKSSSFLFDHAVMVAGGD